MLGPILVSVHNMRFYQRLMADIRSAIADGSFADMAKNDPRRLIEPAEVKASEVENGKEEEV
jgi:tRNA-guanine family transglycosylase